MSNKKQRIPESRKEQTRPEKKKRTLVEREQATDKSSGFSKSGIF